MRQQLLDDGYRFEFFQAVRLLQRMSPSLQPVGASGPPVAEIVRFRTLPSLGFPPSQIHEVRDGVRPDAPPEMTVAFFGLTGPLGLLPHPYTELLLDRVRHQDSTLWDFLDLFNHRLISLFYRAWEKYRFPISYERNRKDPFTEYLFDLIGMGTAGLKGRTSVPDQGLLLFAGLIAQKPHSASASESILRGYFGVEVAIEQYRGQWIALDEEYRTRLGAANSALGVDVVCGERVWNVQSNFRVRLGPLRFQQYMSFLPSGPSFRPLGDLTRFLAGQELDFDVQPVLKAAEVPPCRLGSDVEVPPMLGWTTWLKTRDLAEDASQVVLSVAN